MKRFLVFILVLMTWPVGAFAEPDPHREAAEKLLVISNINQRLEVSKKQVRESYSKLLNAYVDNNFSKEEADTLAGKIGDIFEQEFTWDKLKDNYINIYVDAFSEQEINELLSFYKSPIGEKYRKNMNGISQRTAEVSQDIVSKIIDRIRIISENDNKQKFNK